MIIKATGHSYVAAHIHDFLSSLLSWGIHPAPLSHGAEPPEQADYQMYCDAW